MQNCIFCKIINGEIPSDKVYEDEYAFAFFSTHPASKYHTLVIPKKHSENIFDIEEKDLKEVMVAVKKVTKIYEDKLGIKNVQIINNSGKEAQQQVFHIHFHVVPRSAGDGHDINWETYPDMTKEFSELIKKLK